MHTATVIVQIHIYRAYKSVNGCNKMHRVFAETINKMDHGARGSHETVPKAHVRTFTRLLVGNSWAPLGGEVLVSWSRGCDRCDRWVRRYTALHRSAQVHLKVNLLVEYFKYDCLSQPSFCTRCRHAQHIIDMLCSSRPHFVPLTQLNL